MSYKNKGYIVLTPDEFKKFLRGQMMDDQYLRPFYSELKSIGTKSIQASKILVDGVIEFDSKDDFDFEIYLDNCVFEKAIRFTNGKFNILSFSSCVFKERINVDNGEFTKWFWFNKCEFENNIVVLNGFFNSFHFFSNNLKEALLIEGGVFENLYLGQTFNKGKITIEGPFTLINKLGINNNDESKINISKCIVNSLTINGIFNSSSVVLVEDIILNSLKIDKTLNLGKIFFLNIDISRNKYFYTDIDVGSIWFNNLVFKEFDSDGIRRTIDKKEILNLISYLNNISSISSFVKRNEKQLIKLLFQKDTNKDSSSLEIFESSLGALEIKNFNVESIKEIYFDTSDLSSCKTINSKFPTKRGRIQSRKSVSKNLYHLYNDLYSISSKQNNVKEKIEYYKASQENLLKSTKEEIFSLKQVSSLMSLYTSKIYSDYGQNWIRSIFIVIFLIGPFFFGLFLLSLKNIEFDFSITGAKYFKEELLQFYPQFLNPTHKLGLMGEVSGLGKLSSTIDLISRIFIGIGVFETIRSFRKYVRK